MAQQNRSGEQLGDYRLLRKLGEGAFGEVYEAEQVYLGTKAAIKLLQAQLDQRELQAFLAEARKIAVLEHPHIARVLGFSFQGEMPYLVMQLAQGSLKDRFPAGQCQPIERILPVIQQAAEGLQYAHDQRIVHLDIKPANLLLGVQGQVLLADFGLSLVLSTKKTHQTMQGFAGTPYYAAPEQFENKPGLASDQYALAIMAYHWLTGVFPFDGEWFVIGHQKLSQEPPPLRAKLATISPAIEQTVLRALARSPKDRFPTIRDFAASLLQLSQPQQAPAPVKPPLRPPPAVVRSRPPLGTVLATCRGHSERLSRLLWFSDGVSLASASADKTVRLWNASSGQPLGLYRSHPDGVNALTCAPDGMRLASAVKNGTIYLWDVANGTLLHIWQGDKNAALLDLAWSPDGSCLACAHADHRIRLWDAATGNVLATWAGHTGIVRHVAWSADGIYLASASNDKTVRVWEASSGKALVSCQGHTSWVCSVAWSPDNTRLASASWDNTVRVWNASGSCVLTCQGHTEPVEDVTWSPDGTRLASTSSDGTVRLWDASSGKLLSLFQRQSAYGNAVAWSPDSSRIASGGADHTIQVWSAG